MANVRKYLQKHIQMARDSFRFNHLFSHSVGNSISNFQFCKSRGYQSGEDNTVSERQLENTVAIHNSAVLSPNKNVYRRNIGISGSKAGKKKSSSPVTIADATNKEGQIMPTQTLIANHYTYFTFNFPSGFSFRRASISYYVESEYPIDTYIVDDIGFQNFQAGQAFTYQGGFLNTTIHRQHVRPPHDGNWYLILNNKQNVNTAIHYEVI